MVVIVPYEVHEPPEALQHPRQGPEDDGPHAHVVDVPERLGAAPTEASALGRVPVAEQRRR